MRARKFSSVTGAVVASLFLVFLSPGAASAGTTSQACTSTSGGHGVCDGESVFDPTDYSAGERFNVYDNKADGLGVELSTYYNGYWKDDWYCGAGHGGACAFYRQIPENTAVAMWVCLKNPTTGAISACSELVWGGKA